MISSVAPIEVSPLADVRTDDAALTVRLKDGRVISTPLEWYPRLAYGTPEERANWRPIADGEGIHWPDLDEDISIEGLIAGRKSGESATSLKRWMQVQADIRQMPRDFRELRREMLQAGPLSADVVAQRARSTVEAYESRPEDWSVAVDADPFEILGASGLQDTSACVVYRADSPQSALEARANCIRFGMRDVTRAGSDADGSIFVLIYSTGTA